MVVALPHKTTEFVGSGNHLHLWAGRWSKQITSQIAPGPWAAIIKACHEIDPKGVNFTNSFIQKLGDGSSIKF